MIRRGVITYPKSSRYLKDTFYSCFGFQKEVFGYQNYSSISKLFLYVRNTNCFFRFQCFGYHILNTVFPLINKCPSSNRCPSWFFAPKNSNSNPLKLCKNYIFKKYLCFRCYQVCVLEVSSKRLPWKLHPGGFRGKWVFEKLFGCVMMLYLRWKDVSFLLHCESSKFDLPHFLFFSHHVTWVVWYCHYWWVLSCYCHCPSFSAWVVVRYNHHCYHWTKRLTYT